MALTYIASHLPLFVLLNTINNTMLVPVDKHIYIATWVEREKVPLTWDLADSIRFDSIRLVHGLKGEVDEPRLCQAEVWWYTWQMAACVAWCVMRASSICLDDSLRRRIKRWFSVDSSFTSRVIYVVHVFKRLPEAEAPSQPGVASASSTQKPCTYSFICWDLHVVFSYRNNLQLGRWFSSRFTLILWVCANQHGIFFTWFTFRHLVSRIFSCVCILNACFRVSSSFWTTNIKEIAALDATASCVKSTRYMLKPTFAADFLHVVPTKVSKHLPVFLPRTQNGFMVCSPTFGLMRATTEGPSLAQRLLWKSRLFFMTSLCIKLVHVAPGGFHGTPFILFYIPLHERHFILPFSNKRENKKA